ncbi:phage major tail tube protein [Aurantimonas sp. C2-6-R+9]|uniref:phage major tail tube protein n=1 Tax=unclassified Aurantimonas TaxID=2638230 RepID=UPI002E17E012|nr:MULTISPECIES: phage major tail tube protein [unclassified Aurantimonas]MEC5291973.1 phage major tail tube protein [Aurantimonas sp. C2-3-R2]MEC5382085.1 phage major tail tube protein [Aurantimonas sp. C2-6-R+9]MEC5413058.1 phage major tail tube protein [Aurantimonas sp. C2-4-R8]
MDLKQISQAHVYDVDQRLFGLVDKLTLDGRKTTEVEHKTLGQVGVLKLPGRPLQAVTGKIMIGHLDDGYDRQLSNPAKQHDWQMHQKVDVSDETGYSFDKSHTIVWHARFRFMEDDGMDTELGEKAGIEYAITLPYLRIFREGDATPIWFLDVFNDVFEVNGERVWKE